MTICRRKVVRISKAELRAQLATALAKYDGSVTHCPPGVARTHESKVTYEPPGPKDDRHREAALRKP